MRGSAAALLGILSLVERLRVPIATICSKWTTQRRVERQIEIGLIDIRGNAPAILAAAYESTTAVSTQSLMYPSHHHFITGHRKLDVDRQPHTKVKRQRRMFGHTLNETAFVLHSHVQACQRRRLANGMRWT